MELSDAFQRGLRHQVVIRGLLSVPNIVLRCNRIPNKLLLCKESNFFGLKVISVYIFICFLIGLILSKLNILM